MGERRGAPQGSGSQDRGLGAGDFTITATVCLEKLEKTAAAFVLDGNQFGFEGSHGKMFVQGPNFGNSRPIADPRKFITAGEPFKLAVTPASFDDMGRLLQELGQGFQYDVLPEADLATGKLKKYDVVFLTCAEPHPSTADEFTQLKAALRDFVSGVANDLILIKPG